MIGNLIIEFDDDVHNRDTALSLAKQALRLKRLNGSDYHEIVSVSGRYDAAVEILGNRIVVRKKENEKPD